MDANPLSLVYWWRNLGRTSAGTVSDVMGRGDLITASTTVSDSGPIQRGRASAVRQLWRPGPAFSNKRIAFLF